MDSHSVTGALPNHNDVVLCSALKFCLGGRWAISKKRNWSINPYIICRRLSDWQCITGHIFKSHTLRTTQLLFLNLYHFPFALKSFLLLESRHHALLLFRLHENLTLQIRIHEFIMIRSLGYFTSTSLQTKYKLRNRYRSVSLPLELCTETSDVWSGLKCALIFLKWLNLALLDLKTCLNYKRE